MVNLGYTGEFDMNVMNVGSLLQTFNKGKGNNPKSASYLDTFLETVYNSDSDISRIKNFGMGVSISKKGLDINSHTEGWDISSVVPGGLLALGRMAMDIGGKIARAARSIYEGLVENNPFKRMPINDPERERAAQRAVQRKRYYDEFIGMGYDPEDAEKWADECSQDGVQVAMLVKDQQTIAEIGSFLFYNTDKKKKENKKLIKKEMKNQNTGKKGLTVEQVAKKLSKEEILKIACTAAAEFSDDEEEELWGIYTILNRVSQQWAGKKTVEDVLNKTGIYGYKSEAYYAYERNLREGKDIRGLLKMVQKVKKQEKGYTNPTKGENMWGGWLPDMNAHKLVSIVNSKGKTINIWAPRDKEDVQKIINDNKHKLNIHIKANCSGNIEHKGGSAFYSIQKVKNYVFKENDVEKIWYEGNPIY